MKYNNGVNVREFTNDIKKGDFVVFEDDIEHKKVYRVERIERGFCLLETLDGIVLNDVDLALLCQWIPNREEIIYDMELHKTTRCIARISNYIYTALNVRGFNCDFTPKVTIFDDNFYEKFCPVIISARNAHICGCITNYVIFY